MQKEESFSEFVDVDFLTDHRVKMKKKKMKIDTVRTSPKIIYTERLIAIDFSGRKFKCE